MGRFELPTACTQGSFRIAAKMACFQVLGFQGDTANLLQLVELRGTRRLWPLHLYLHSGKIGTQRTNAMALEHSNQRQHAHAFIDRLPADQLSAVCGLLETMLSPLDRKLALAPIDDEPLTPGEAAAIQAGISSLEQGGGVPLEEVLADFGITVDDFDKMADNPASEDAA
jgi:hypothetical protein